MRFALKKTDVQKYLFAWVICACHMTAVLFLCIGCVSRHKNAPIQPFAASGTEADVYIFAPVSGNEKLLTALLTAFIPENTAQQYLQRTSAFYIGIVYGDTPTVTLTSNGIYPVHLSNFLFSKNNGWEKHHHPSYGGYYHSQTADIVLQKNAAFALLGNGAQNIDSFLYRIQHPLMPVFPVMFQKLLDTGSHGEIGLYARAGALTAAALFGLQDVRLPIESMEFYLKKDTDASYRYTAVFESSATRIALILKILLGTVLRGTVSVQDTAVLVENASISESELAAFFKAFTDIQKSSTQK